MVILIKVLQVLIALSALIIIHEFGHFLFARIFGVRVEKFYLFMDAGGFRLFSTKHNKLIRKYFPKPANADTDFGIGWLPLGGYCKISGMVDESLDTAQLKGEPRQDEFRSKPAWQRLLIMSGGVLFNFIFAIILYISILATWGEAYISNRDTQIYVNELSYDMGFRNGDRILGIDGVYEENFGMLQAELARSNAEKVSVLRDGDTLDIYIDRSRISEILGTPGMFDVAVPFVIDSVSADSPNSGTGLLRGDHIVAIDGEAVEWLQDGRRVLAEHSNEAVDVLLLRSCGSAEQPADSICLTLQVDSLGRLGVFTRPIGFQTRDYGILEAIPAGFKLTFSTIGGYLKDLKLVATPSTGAYKSVGSFISIGQVFPSSWNWYAFINILALLSIMLGVMNLIPIPGLDGGHIMFTIYEMITGRKPSDRFLIVAQIIGMVLLLGLMFLAFGNDISRLIR